MKPVVTILLIGFIMDSILGDPRYPLHPVRLIGGMISYLKKLFFAIDMKGRMMGALSVIVTLLAVINVYIIIRILLEDVSHYIIFAIDIFILYSCIALKDMIKHIRPVAAALGDGDIDTARSKLQMVVGRKTDELDKHAAARAAVETTSESFVDGFFAPLFWYFTASIISNYFFVSEAGLPVCAILTYRVVNTFDSIIGYKSEELRDFGCFAARFDDILNFIPARLSILVLMPAAAICRSDFLNGWKTALRDRLNHASPNSGHPESFIAGALGLKLGGPSLYPHGLVDKPWIGDGTEKADSSHIISACRIISIAGWITVALLSIILTVV